MDPAQLIALLAKYEDQIDTMAMTIRGIEVIDDTTCHTATLYTTQAKKLRQTVDAEHKRLKEPYLNVTRELDGFRKRISDRIQDIEDMVNGKIRPYLQQKENERREAERKAREEAARLQAELDARARAEAMRLADEARQKALAEKKSKAEAEAAAKAAEVMAEPAPIIVVAIEKETKAVTESGTAKLKEEWTWAITNFKDLPDAAFDFRKDEVTKALSPWINAQVKAGIRNIPGVKIFKQTIINTRTRR